MKLLQKILFAFIFISVIASIPDYQVLHARIKPSSISTLHFGKLIPEGTLPPGIQTAHVGLYGVNVYDLNVRENTYRLSGYLWLRWKGDIDPFKGLEFTNLVENWSLVKTTLLPAPKILADGSKYQIMHFEGRFYQPFDLTNYPLDRQTLSLYIENSQLTYDELRYIQDPDSNGYDYRLYIPGWEILGLSTQTYLHDYRSDFGEIGSASASRFSTLQFAFTLDRQINYFIWKMLVPLFVVLLTNWLALLLNPILVEVRTAMPATVLLTLVFMQKSAMEAIPECPSLVLVDKIYLLGYVFVVLTLMQVVTVHAYLYKNNDSPESVARMIKFDKISVVFQLITFICVMAVLLMQVYK
ncbi:MAG: hypothetical protein WCL46_06405 [Chlorobium sp.]